MCVSCCTAVNCSSILVSADGRQLKIADFGLARSIALQKRSLTIEVVTRWYRAPEIMLGDTHYTCSIDVWAVGCIMAEMLHSHHHPLLPGDSEIDQLHRSFLLFGTPVRETWPEALEMPNWRNTFPQWPAQRIHWNRVLVRSSHVTIIVGMPHFPPNYV